MAPSVFNMEDVYSSGEQVPKINNNQKVTLEFGDFESNLFIEPADEADLSNISEDDTYQESVGHLSNIKSSIDGSHSIPGPTVELAEDEIPIYSAREMLTIIFCEIVGE
jgi:hypothetical protein